MTLNFQKVHLHGFLSFGDAEVQLSNKGYVFVKGINQNLEDGTSNNGSGKSTLFESIVWTITGSTIRGTKDVVNHNMTEGCYVELWFNCDGKNYHLIRSKDSDIYKTNLKIFIDDADMSGKGIRDTEKLLAQYLPDLSSLLLGSVVVLGQGLPQRFSNNTPAGRKEILEKLSKSDFMIEDLKQRVGDRKSQLSGQIRTIDNTLISLSSTKSVYESQLKSNQSQLENLGTPNKFDSLIIELNQKCNDVKLVYENLQKQLQENTQETEKLNQQYVEIVTAEQAEIASVERKYASQRDEAQQKTNYINQQIYALKQEIKRIENIKDVCPTCGQKLPNVNKPTTTEQRAQLAQLDQDAIAGNKLYTDICSQIATEQAQVSEKYKNERASLSLKISQLKSDYQSISQSIQRANNDQLTYSQQLTNAVNEKNSFEDKKKNIESTISSLTSSISEISQKMLYNNNERDTLGSHLDRVEKFETLLKRDFRGYLLGNIIEYINKKAKEYAVDVFGTDKISFKLNGNDIDISYSDKELESLSGGERQKVDLIVQFSIRDMLCKFLGLRVNVLILDEIFDNLDPTGCQKVLNLISTKLQNVDSIYIVSHHSDLAIPYDSELTVLKDSNAISRILD